VGTPLAGILVTKLITVTVYKIQLTQQVLTNKVIRIKKKNKNKIYIVAPMRTYTESEHEKKSRTQQLSTYGVGNDD